MTISKKLGAIAMTGLALSAWSICGAVKPLSAAPAASAAAVVVDDIPYQPITPEIASQLPWFLRPGAVGMSPTVDDLRVQQPARALFVNAIEHARRGDLGNYATRKQYDQGVTAYAEGNYMDAIADFTPLCR